MKKDSTNEAKNQENSAPAAEEATTVAEEVKEETGAEVKEEPKKNKELDELKDKYIRICAEYENYRKRTDKEKSESYSSGIMFAVKQLLPVLDNLDRALDYDKDNEGMNMIIKQIKDAFSKLGIEEIESDGKEFDPEIHDAIMHEENPDMGEKMVAQTFQKGYMLNGKVIRHAMVKVVN